MELGRRREDGEGRREVEKERKEVEEKENCEGKGD